MSMRAIEFVENWVSENIAADGQEPAGSGAMASALAAPALAARCLAAATAAGILQSEIEETFDDLSAFMAGEIEGAEAREANAEDGAGDDR